MIVITEDLQFIEDEINNFWWHRIWTTKKIRINAEHIRISWNKQLQFLSNYYSTMIVAFSVLFFVNPKEQMELVMLLVSIFSLGLGAVTSRFELEKKANEFKKSHILLDKLEAKAIHLEYETKNRSLSFEDANTQFLQLKNEYADIMSETDNHTNYDLLKFLQSQKLKKIKDRKKEDNEDKILWGTWFKYFKNNLKYYLLKLRNWFVFLILIAAPLLIILKMIFNNFN
ncbi:MAG: SLATT domain-containing protein [Tetragenococcus koreensis]|nr:SLATT domain-containing protein [Tetragenococcus koreensis]